MIPSLVLSDSKGNIYVHPELKMAASDGRSFVHPQRSDMIALPKGSTIFSMPGHTAVAWDSKNSIYVTVKEYCGKKVFPASCFLIPGFTRTCLPAAQKDRAGIMLPLWPYTALGWSNGKFYASAVQTDTLRRQRPFYYKETSLIKRNIAAALKIFPKNRLFKHLARCALFYNCRNAQDLFLKRGEAPLPVSPVCNSRCLGCLSFQDADCGIASHERISFVPAPQEVFEVASSHIAGARQALVSFGQGCEGEPLLQFPVLKESIRLLRKHTAKGTVHLNTNGSLPAALERLAAVGLDSVRISLNSLDEKIYDSYYLPNGYRVRDVLDSARLAKKRGLFVSLNLLVFPGFTDAESQVRLLAAFLKKGFVDLLQMRNLSIDPDFLKNRLSLPQGRPMGIPGMLSFLKKACPRLRTGYFNLPKEKF